MQCGQHAEQNGVGKLSCVCLQVRLKLEMCRDRAGLAMCGTDVAYRLDAAFAGQDHEASCPSCYRIAYLLRLAAVTQPLGPPAARAIAAIDALGSSFSEQHSAGR